MDVAALVISIFSAIGALISALYARSASDAAKKAVQLEEAAQKRSAARDAVECAYGQVQDIEAECARLFGLRRDRSVPTGWMANETQRAKLGPTIDSFASRVKQLDTDLHAGIRKSDDVLAAASALMTEISAWHKAQLG